jgi:hypothetical protein
MSAAGLREQASRPAACPVTSIDCDKEDLMRPANTNNFVLFLVGLCLLCSGAASAQQKPKKAPPKEESGQEAKGEGGQLQLKHLPPAVQKTVEEQTRGAMIVGISSEKEGGKTIYEVETKVNGRSRDMLIDSAGKLTEVEEEVDIASLPPGVQAEVKKSLGPGQAERLESVTKAGVFSGYEAVVVRGGKKVAVSMGPDGKVPPAKRKE